jgi:SAM-dependent methyltransferase
MLAINMYVCINPRQIGKCILEIGYGSGTLTRMFLKNNNCKYHGYEKSLSAKINMSRIDNFIDHVDIYSIKEKFDFILLSNVIEHIKFDNHFLVYLFSLLNIGGSICLTFPTDKKPDNDPRHYRTYNLKKYSEDLLLLFPNSRISHRYLPPTYFLDSVRSVIILIGRTCLPSNKYAASVHNNEATNSSQSHFLTRILYLYLAIPIMKLLLRLDNILSYYFSSCQGFIEIKKQ